MTSILRFAPGGHIGCLYTEAIDLRALGRLQVVRATDIRFNHTIQQWDVHAADTGQVLFSHPSRTECLRWEHQNLQPGTPSENLTPQPSCKTNSPPISKPATPVLPSSVPKKPAPRLKSPPHARHSNAVFTPGPPLKGWSIRRKAG